MINTIKSVIRGTINIRKLEKNGLKHGVNLNIQHGVIIDPGHCWLIDIGDNVTLASNVHILAHDASTKLFLGFTKIAKTKIGSNVFIGAGTIILPGVVIGDNVIVGAGSIVTHNLDSNGLYMGTPAKKIMDLDTWLKKKQNEIDNSICYDSSFIIGNITDAKKQQMINDLNNHSGFIV